MQKIVRSVYILLFLAVLYFPIITLVANSFNSSLYGVKWEGFTFFWYLKAIKNEALIDAFKNSLILSLASAFCSIGLGGLCAFGFYRYKYLGRKFLYFFVQFMISFPDIILGVSLLLLFILINLKLGFVSLLISHIILCLPFVIIIILSGFRDLDKNIIEAGIDLGASDFMVLRKIILPNIFPNIVSAFLVSVTLSLDDVIISYFVSGPDYQILPLVIYSLARQGIKPEVNAVCSFVLIVSFIFILLSQIIVRRSK
ncbi:MAG: spermidine/putrescine transport system permease protein [Candidatus Midichloriaceae bacterium]|jgi:spermidine/putrescine transport system permease protein